MKGMWRNIAALLLVCVLAAVSPGLSGASRAAEGGGSYSLTVGLSVDETDEEAARADIVVDLYHVAAVEGDGWIPVGVFAGLTLPTDLEDAAVWDAFAQEAARIVLPEGGAPLAPERTAGMTDGHAEFTGLEGGLYLPLAHGRGAEDYVTVLKDGRLATRADGESKVYTFLPQVVAVPAPGEVFMKFAEDPNLGDLEIVKTLTGYVDGQPGVFVFEVEAVLDGVPVYSDVVSVTFTGAGVQSVLVEGIPVGAEVTVTEVYSGAGYRLVTDRTQTAVIGGAEPASVSFTNEATGGNRGGSVTNYFTYDESLGWAWTPIPDAP